jgi:phospholipid-binding lipoprotein MlaA
MRRWRKAIAVTTMLVCSGAVRADQIPIKAETDPTVTGTDPAAPSDPIEGFNRKMFWFNEQLDRFVMTPVAKGWDWVTPDAVQRGVSRFFDNSRLPIVFVNDLLQGKPKAAAVDAGRFLLNTVVGLVGFLDPATEWGLTDHDEDFGQTLAVWGLGPGPYLVVPIWGPSNVRDGTGALTDNAWVWFVPGFYTTAARAGWAVNDRSLVLREVDEARKASLDFYAAVRDAYAQRRRRLIADEIDTKVHDEEGLYFPIGND